MVHLIVDYFTAIHVVITASSRNSEYGPGLVT